MRVVRPAALFAFWIVVASCSGGDSETGPRRHASSVAIDAGNNQTAEVATAVPVAPSVLVKDERGNPLGSVVVTFAVQTGGGTLVHAQDTTDAIGLASVGSWTLGTQAGTNTLRATVSGLTAVNFTATGTPGPASALALSTPPSGSVGSGAVFPQQPVVQLHDAYGNTRTQAGVPVTVGITAGGGALSGTITVNTDALGEAAFTDLAITGSLGPRTLTFSSGGLTPVLSGAVNISAGPPAGIIPTTSTVLGGTVGQLVSNRPGVRVTDVNGNPVIGAIVTFTAVTGGGSVNGGSVATTVGGIAIVGGWTLGTFAGDNTLDATVGGLPPVTFTASAFAGPPTQLALLIQPGASVLSGVILNPTPWVQVQDAYDNNVLQSGTVISASVASGGGAVSGETSIATDGTGRAVFGGLKVSGASGNRTLAFSAPGLTPAISTPFSLIAGGATTIVASSPTTQSGTAGAPVPTLPAVLVSDKDGNPVAGVTVTFGGLSGGGTISGALKSTNVNGVATLGGWTLGPVVGSNIIVASASGLSGSPVVFTANAQAGATSKLAVDLQPSATAVSGSPLGVQPKVSLRDAAGNAVSQAGVTITAGLASGGGVLGGTATASTNANGQASFTNLSIAGQSGARTLSFTAAGLTPTTSAPISLSGAGASALAAASVTAQFQTVGLAVLTPPVVRASDADGNPVAGVTVTFAITSGGGALTGASAVTNASGVATVGSWTLGLATGPNSVSATATGLSGSPVTFNATGTASTPHHLAITVSPPATAQSGVPLAPQPVLRLRDAANNPVNQGGVVVTASILSGGGTLGGQSSVATNAIGLATFSDLSLDGPVGTRTLSFSAPSVAGATSGSIVVSAGPAAGLFVSGGNNQTAPAGAAVPVAPSVVARDAGGNPVSGVQVTFQVASGGGSRTGGSQTTGSDGIATVTSWTLGAAPGANTLTATAAGLTGSPRTFTATGTAAGANILQLATPPSAAVQSGVQFTQQPQVQLANSGGTPIAQAGVTVTAALATGGGALSGTATAVTNAAGLATFGNLFLVGLAGPRTLLFRAPAFQSVGSGTLTVAAGPAASIQASAGDNQTATAGTAVAVDPVVVVHDASGNPVSGVAVSFAVGSGGGSRTGANQTTGVNGLAKVGSWTLGPVAGSNTLTATSAGLVGTPVTFSAAALPDAAAQLAIAIQPSTPAKSGQPFTQQPVIQLEDAGGNSVAQAGVVVTVTISTGGGTLGGSSTATTNSAGLATFTDLSLSGIVGNRTLQFTAGGLGSVTSSTIALAAGAPSVLAKTTGDNQSGTVGTPVAIDPTVLVSDASGNPVPGIPVSFAVASGGGSRTGGNPITNASGIAKVGSWILGTAAGANTLTAAVAGASGSPATFTATGIAAAAAGLTFTTSPSGSAQSGVAFGSQPSIQLSDAAGNSVAQAGVVVTAAIVTGGGTLGGTPTASTNAQGLATFSNLSLSGTAGVRSLSFSAPSLPPITQSGIVVAAGPAATLSRQGGDNQTAIAGSTVPGSVSVRVTDASGNPVDGVSVTFAIASGGGSITGSTTTTDPNGIAAVGSWSLGATFGVNTITASAAGLSGSPATFTATGVNVDSPRLSISTQPSTTSQSGAILARQPAVRLQDSFGNNISLGGVHITASIATGDGVSAGSAVATTGPNGRAVFSGLSLSGPAGPVTLAFTTSGYTSVASLPVDLTAGPPARIDPIAGDAQTATVGTAVGTMPSVRVTDLSGNPVSGTGVTFAVTGGGGAVTGGSATTNQAGVAQATSWTLGSIPSANTLGATAAGLAGSPITFVATGVAGPPSALAVVVQPGGAASGVSFNTQPSVALVDALGNTVALSGVAITAAIGTGGGTLGGATTVATDDNGVAAFADLEIVGLVGSRTLSFSSAGVAGVNSNGFSLAAGPAAALAISIQPSTGVTNGSQLAQQPSVHLVDNAGNSVSQAGVLVTVSRSLAGANLGGTLGSTTDAGGVAAFSDLSLTGTVGSYTLRFASSGLGIVVSGSISITAGAAVTVLPLSTQSQTAAAGTDVANPPSVQVVDQSGNPVAGVNVTFSVTAGGGSAAPVGAIATDPSGTATLTAWTLGPLVGVQTVSASAASVPVSINFNATAF